MIKPSVRLRRVQMNFKEEKVATEQSRMSHFTNDTDNDEDLDKGGRL